MNIQTVVIVALIVTGCATTSIPTAQTTLVPSDRIYVTSYLAKSPGRGMVIVKRDSPRFGLNCKNIIYIDGIEIGQIEPSERLELYLSTTEHIVGVSKPTCGGELREITVTPSITAPKTLRVWSDQDGHLQLQPTAF